MKGNVSFTQMLGRCNFAKKGGRETTNIVGFRAAAITGCSGCGEKNDNMPQLRHCARTFQDMPTCKMTKEQAVWI